MAQKASVATSTVADFERGKRVPVANNLEALRSTLETAGVIFQQGGVVAGVKREAYESAGLKPWAIDAAGVDVSKAGTPYCTPQLRAYLSEGIGSLHRILVAPKGYGKTLYLKCKARQIREKYGDSVLTHPSRVQDVEFLKLSLDWREQWHDVARLTINTWSLLWQFVLLSKGVQLAGVPSEADNYLRELLSRTSEPVSDLLSAVIRDRDQLSTNLTQRLRVARRAFNDAESSVAIFIDNADEMFVGLNRVDQFSDTELDEQSSIEVAKANPAMWHAAQVGLLLAVRELERSAPGLSVYTTLRAEAVNTARHEDALQAKSYVVPIHYSADDLKEIFAWHVNRMPTEDLVEPGRTDPAERLMGSEPLEHRYVRFEGKLLQEEPFNLLLRHTTHSPRDLIVVGGGIARLPKSERVGAGRNSSIRRAIDSAVSSLFLYFQSNAIPRWDMTWQNTLREVNGPVIQGDLAGVQLGSAGPKLYAYGLLGIAERTGRPGRYSQLFLTQWDNAYAAQGSTLPKSDYYFLHPWLQEWASRQSPNFQSEPSNVIGNGCTYQAPGLLTLCITKDANGNPALASEGELDIPVGSGDQLPSAALLFFSLLLACRRGHTTQITKAQLKEGREEFDRLFPKYRGVIQMNPFDNQDHRSHLRAQIFRVFPVLAHKVVRLNGAIGVVGWQGSGSEPRVEMDFIDVEALSIDLP